MGVCLTDSSSGAWGTDGSSGPRSGGGLEIGVCGAVATGDWGTVATGDYTGSSASGLAASRAAWRYSSFSAFSSAIFSLRISYGVFLGTCAILRGDFSSALPSLPGLPVPWPPRLFFKFSIANLAISIYASWLSTSFLSLSVRVNTAFFNSLNFVSICSYKVFACVVACSMVCYLKRLSLSFKIFTSPKSSVV